LLTGWKEDWLRLTDWERPIRFGGFAAVVAILLFHLSGCGGAGGATPVPQIVAPPGMSATKVTASSGGVTPQTI